MRKGSLGVTFFSVRMYVDMSANFGKFDSECQGWPGMAGDGRGWPGMVGVAHPHTPTHTHTLFSKRPFLVNFY